MARARIPTAAGEQAIEAALAGETARETVATAVRYLLQLLDERAPGNAVEVRVPPYGAVQVIEGPAHTRGTPPNVVEMDAATWIPLAAGRLTWAEALRGGRISASGLRADLSEHLPIRPSGSGGGTIGP